MPLFGVLHQDPFYIIIFLINMNTYLQNLKYKTTNPIKSKTYSLQSIQFVFFTSNERTLVT